ncbi:hypothetical protein [uncultured Roseibium sp.]|uniref:hypothetical protein n=1 Tax=uncultured Roseibium sp. TaxID=1936171 RepID=UPI0026212018|nr:hypothetical protein [uncultured Roseibium sp.]
MSILPERFVSEGTAEDDVLFGTLVSSLKGKGGNDVLVSGGGNVWMSGGKGKDTLDARDEGTTISEGGRNADIFIFDDKGGNHAVTDFSRKEFDKIQLFGDSEFDWQRTDLFEVTVSYGDTTIVFENMTGREFSYDDVFV